ncbi:glycosyltransferase, partial [Streptomyces sp. T-3]|nr:glycosyltransferase [Streptomyces sp. T-3]
MPAAPAVQEVPQVKIAFLLFNAYGIGGTIRSTFNLASALAAARHDVEIVSVHSAKDKPALALSPKVRLTDLVDLRPGSATYDGDDPLTREPSSVCVHDGAASAKFAAPTGLTERRMADYLASTDADVVIATRPYLVCCLAEFGQRRYLRIGQEHLTHDMHRDPLRGDQNAAICELDAFVTVSEGDAASYRAALPGVDTRIQCIPNGSPALGVEPSGGGAKVVVAAGRLIKVKRYDRLIDAFAKVATVRPDWTLRLYGRGDERKKLAARIDRLGLHNHVFLMGAHSPIETEWAKGAIAAVSSDGESFGMTIVEAMHCGVPVVSTDCKYGPGEIIKHGEDGLLVPLDAEDEAKTVAAYADALIELIDDPERRARMGAAARANSQRYLPAHIAGRYEELFAELRGETPTSATPAPAPTSALRAQA